MDMKAISKAPAGMPLDQRDEKYCGQMGKLVAGTLYQSFQLHCNDTNTFH